MRQELCENGRDQQRRWSTTRLLLERLPPLSLSLSLLEGCRVNKGFNGPRGRFGMTRKYLEFHPSALFLPALVLLFALDSDRQAERVLIVLLVRIRITSSRSGRIALCPIRRTSQACCRSNVESEIRLRNSFPSSRKNLIPPSRNEHNDGSLLLIVASFEHDENFARKEEEDR